MAQEGFDKEKARSDFLMAMYKEMMNDINRHIVVVWQSVSVLVGAFAVWSLVDKNIISIDVAATLIVIISIWVLAHVYDAAYWYNRNLVIIANIERQFLTQKDLKDIHYYFGAHRETSSMLTHLRLQRALAIGISALVLGVHFFQVLWPAIKFSKWSLENVLPWIALAIGLYIWRQRHQLAKTKYAEFLENSPGRDVDATGIRFGIGHPEHKVEKNDKK